MSIEGREVTLIIWDIAGETEQNKVPTSYQLGAHGVLYVFDITRPSTYNNLLEQVNHMKALLPNAPIQVLANKIDLLTESERNSILANLDFINVHETSAKTGQNVELVFELLTKAMIP